MKPSDNDKERLQVRYKYLIDLYQTYVLRGDDVISNMYLSLASELESAYYILTGEDIAPPS